MQPTPAREHESVMALGGTPMSLMKNDQKMMDISITNSNYINKSITFRLKTSETFKGPLEDIYLHGKALYILDKDNKLRKVLFSIVTN